MGKYYETVLHRMKSIKRYESMDSKFHEPLPRHCYSIIELSENP
jgi:hypothetical protein